MLCNTDGNGKRSLKDDVGNVFFYIGNMFSLKKKKVCKEENDLIATVGVERVGFCFFPRCGMLFYVKNASFLLELFLQYKKIPCCLWDFIFVLLTQRRIIR